jgi:hypothetical protein
MKIQFKKVLEPFMTLSKSEFHWIFYLRQLSGEEKYSVVMTPRLLEKFVETCRLHGVEYSMSHARNSFYRLVKNGFLEKAEVRGAYMFNQKIFSYE